MVDGTQQTTVPAPLETFPSISDDSPAPIETKSKKPKGHKSKGHKTTTAAGEGLNPTLAFSGFSTIFPDTASYDVVTETLSYTITGEGEGMGSNPGSNPDSSESSMGDSEQTSEGNGSAPSDPTDSNVGTTDFNGALVSLVARASDCLSFSAGFQIEHFTVLFYSRCFYLAVALVFEE
jgi:hypothetical protein